MRRGQIASLILLAMLVVVAVALPDAFLVPWLAPSIGVVAVCTLVAIPVNRSGHVGTAALLLITMVDLSLAGAILLAPGGLDPLYIPAFYMLVTSQLIAVSLLSPSTAFLLAFTHSAFILADVRFQLHTMMWEQMVTSQGILYSLVVGPIALHFIVAFVAYLWVASAHTALRRADRAEEIAELERREVERVRELEAGVHEVLAVHVQLANGNFQARVHNVTNPLLWQIANSLNNLVGRLASYSKEQAQAQFTLYRTREEAERIAEALVARRAGHWSSLPSPSGTPLDPVLEVLRTGDRVHEVPGMAAPSSAPHSTPQSAPSADVGGWHAPPSGPYNQQSAPGWEDPAANLPDWLRKQ